MIGTILSIIGATLALLLAFCFGFVVAVWGITMLLRKSHYRMTGSGQIVPNQATHPVLWTMMQDEPVNIDEYIKQASHWREN